MSVITKAIIPAAGLGTRFLPATKAIPKEMLPIVDIPTIQYVIDEAVSSGIKNILIVVSYNKNAIIRYFHQDHFLEESLSKANKIKELHKIQSLNRNVKIRFVYQHNICGLGDAILCGRKFIGNEPFAVLLGDDVVFRDHKTPPAIKQCIDVYNTQHATVVGVQNVPKTEVSKYGIIQPHKYLSADHRLSAVKWIIEKPAITKAPSTLAICGRYVLMPTIFNFLKKLEPSVGSEVQLTDAICQACEQESVFAYNFKGNRHDIGSKLGLIGAIIDRSLADQEIASAVKKMLRKKFKY